jgi:transcriptional regulator with XRE-family HTH domain
VNYFILKKETHERFCRPEYFLAHANGGRVLMRNTVYEIQDSPASIGELIKEKRILYGLRQKDVANMLHVSADAVSTWEKGDRVPGRENFERLRSVLNIPYFNIWCAIQGYAVRDGHVILANPDALPEKEALAHQENLSKGYRSIGCRIRLENGFRFDYDFNKLPFDMRELIEEEKEKFKTDYLKREGIRESQFLRQLVLSPEELLFGKGTL